MPPQKEQRFIIPAIVIFILLYLSSYAWVNFHSPLWYGMDMFTYSYEGRLMYESRSLFPDDWIYSNQYHIVSSPNVSALFFGLCKDSVTAMAFSTSCFTLLTILSFIWCVNLEISGLGLGLSTLCILGGTIFGYHAATYISGFQVLYTMCSYYGCYLIGILLSVGCWLRIRDGQRVHWGMLLLVVLLNFALGMQSLREMLILNIPLLLIESGYVVYDWARRKKILLSFLLNKSLIFVIALFLAELAGHLFMGLLHVPTTPNIDDLSLNLSLPGLGYSLWASVKNILRISGLAIASDGLCYLPLSICALIISLFIIWSLVHIIRIKDDRPLAKAILFSLISVVCVFGIGVFLMRTRDIYYFVYWLLAALSVAYVIDNAQHMFSKPIILLVLIVCAVNYCFNFIPVFNEYRENNRSLTTFTDSLIDRGVNVIYSGGAAPVFAAASHDQIVTQAIWIDINQESGYPLNYFPSDKHLAIYDDDHYSGSLICFSNDFLTYITHSATQEYQDSLMKHLAFFDEIVLGNRRFVLFKPDGRVIAPYVRQ